MKYRYATLITAAMPFLIAAQPTLNQADNAPEYGSSFDVHRQGVLIHAGGSGAGQNWDFSDLSSATNHIWEVENSTGVVGTHMLRDGVDSLYYNITNDGMYLVREHVLMSLPIGGGQVHTNYTDAPRILKFPGVIGDEWTDPVNASYTMENGSMTRIGTLMGHVDAEGTITLPNAYAMDAIRVHTLMNTSENGTISSIPISGTRSVHTWSFYTTWLKHPLLTIVADTIVAFNTTVPTAKVEWLDEVSVGIIEAIENDAAFGVWPTPATDVLNVTLKEFEGTTARAILIDLKGQIVREWTVTPSGNNTLDIAGISDGQYMLQVAQAGRMIGARKVIIAQH